MAFAVIFHMCWTFCVEIHKFFLLNMTNLTENGRLGHEQYIGKERRHFIQLPDGAKSKLIRCILTNLGAVTLLFLRTD